MFGEQYPQIAKVFVSAKSTKDVNGDLVAGAITFTEYKCRAEFMRGGGFIQNADGTRSDFSWLIYMGPITGYIQAGSKMEVRDSDGNLTMQGTIVRFLKSDFNCRVWLV
jgi:hypothetical protein